jgi:hypothetical protein
MLRPYASKKSEPRQGQGQIRGLLKACNEKRRNAVEVVLAREGARVVCLPNCDVN